MIDNLSSSCLPVFYHMQYQLTPLLFTDKADKLLLQARDQQFHFSPEKKQNQKTKISCKHFTNNLSFTPVFH